MQSLQAKMPGWYTIKDRADGPARIDIYDEIGLFAVSAQSFITDLAALKGNGDIDLHLNSPGGDVFDGIAIFNALKQRQGTVSVVVDGLAASAASFIAMAASPGELAMAPHSQMMIHDAMSMAIGNASDMTDTAALLDKASDNIASIYAERTGKPVAFWRGQMKAETWYSDQEAVDSGLADKIHGKQPALSDDWDLSVFAKYATGLRNGTNDHWNRPLASSIPPVLVNADGNHAPMKGSHTHGHPAYGAQGSDSTHSHEHSHDGDAAHGHHKTPAAPEPPAGDGPSDALGTIYVPKPYQRTFSETAECPSCRCWNGSDAKFCDQCGTKLVGRSDVNESGMGAAAEVRIVAAYCGPCGTKHEAGKQFCASCGKRLSMADSSGWVQDPDGAWRFDPTNKGAPEDDSKPETDYDHDYWTPQGKLRPGKVIPPCPGDVGDFLYRQLLNADVDNSPWDAGKAWAAGAASDDPAAFYKGICAGRKSGDPSTQDAWALPYKYSPSSAPNAAGVRNALARLSSTQGLTNKGEAESLLEKLMKTINPDYEPSSDRIDPGLLSAALLSGLEG
jgi:ATP-dependent Clp endopeptidase proteolytic subunit ClpP